VVATRARWRVDSKSSGKTSVADERVGDGETGKIVGGGMMTGNAEGDGCD
jgi:hypothetical protein